MRQRRFYRPPRAEEVHADDRLERVGVRVAHQPAAADARVDDDRVDRAEARERPVDRGLHLVAVCDVALEGGAAISACGGDALELLRLEAHHGDVRAPGGGPARGFGADPAGGACDEDGLPVEAHACEPTACSMRGPIRSSISSISSEQKSKARSSAAGSTLSGVSVGWW